MPLKYMKMHINRMKKEIKKYSGVIVPMVTPFNADLTIDIYSVSQILKTFTLNNVSTFILGTTGESVSIPESQKNLLVKTTVEKIKGQIKIYAGISGNCLYDSIETGNRFADMGVDVVVIHLPFFFPLSDDAMLRYFEAVANSVQCPVVLYNNPLTLRWSTPLEVIDKLSTHPNVVGFKDSESGLDRVDRAVKLWSRRSDFSYLMGCAAQSDYALLRGCDGIVPSTGNLVPELYRELYISVLNGNPEEAAKYQRLTDSVSAVYQTRRDISHSIPALKTVMSEYGLCKPHVMPPMYDTETEEQETLKKQVREVMETFKNLAE